ncbi:protein translocase subunit SecF [Agarivorans albus]|uniref:Protein-export membrane protein SecF n=1 Tax=Agarivorans albus MKT 106 TaxID=1331007 RepID=R9PP57_AGAAL|nr:protein translocase subunit SecF [Agarivorans albus]GAD03139.1 protein-export membrane protein SecF [Agarivorans albus MKT 106]
MKAWINRFSLTALRQGALNLSVVLVLASVVGLVTKGISFGVDFTGGVVTELATHYPPEQEQMAKQLDLLLVDGYSMSRSGSNHWIIRQGLDISEAVTANWHSQLPDAWQVELLGSSIIGPQVGSELFEMGGLAIFASLLAMMIYLSFRFEWRLALASVIALFHDVLLVLGLFAWLQIEFDLTVMAAVLAVIGYSLNDSIVIGDRIREYLRASSKIELDTQINRALVSTMTRTLVTSGTTLLTVACIWLLAGAPLQAFATALFSGIVIGTFSSVGIGATLPKVLGLQASDYQLIEPTRNGRVG